jgi:hypothetical protein
MSTYDLMMFSLSIWLIYMFKKTLPLGLMLEQGGKIERVYLKRSLFCIWLVTLLPGMTLALGIEDYFGSVYYLIQRLLGFGLAFPSFTIAGILITILRHEREHKHRQQNLPTNDANQNTND